MLSFSVRQRLNGCNEGVVLRLVGFHGELGVDASLGVWHLGLPLFASQLGIEVSGGAINEDTLWLPVRNFIEHAG